DTADAHAGDEAGGGDVEALPDVPASPQRVGERAGDTTDDRSPDGDAALGQREDVADVVAVVAPVFRDEEEARAEDAAGDADEGERVGGVFVEADRAGDPEGEADADEDADGGEEAVPGEEEPTDLGDIRIEGEFDREHAGERWHGVQVGLRAGEWC